MQRAFADAHPTGKPYAPKPQSFKTVVQKVDTKVSTFCSTAVNVKVQTAQPAGRPGPGWSGNSCNAHSLRPVAAGTVCCGTPAMPREMVRCGTRSATL